MALILSIETSANVCSVALHRDGILISISEVFIQKSHSQILTLQCEQLIMNSGFRLSDMDAIAVSMGPGSYTGLRIGVATAKGYCLSLGKPLIAINTLDALAKGMSMYNMQNAMLCPMIDARRSEVYYGLYSPSLDIVEPTAPLILDQDSFKSYLDQLNIIFFGSGSTKFKDMIGDVGNARFVEGVFPSARYIGELAEMKFKENAFEDLIYFEPFYLKEFRSTSLK